MGHSRSRVPRVARCLSKERATASLQSLHAVSPLGDASRAHRRSSLERMTQIKSRALVIAILLMGIASGAALSAERARADERNRFLMSLRLDNDAFAGSDRGYTNGVQIGLTSPTVASFEDARTVAAPPMAQSPTRLAAAARVRGKQRYADTRPRDVHAGGLATQRTRPARPTLRGRACRRRDLQRPQCRQNANNDAQRRNGRSVRWRRADARLRA